MTSLNSSKKIVYLVIVLVFVGLSGCDNPVSNDNDYTEKPVNKEIASYPDGNGGKIDGQYIVVFKKDMTGSDVTDTANKMAAKSRAQVKHVYNKALKGFTITLPEQTLEEDLEALRNDPDVAYIEQDFEIYGGESQTNATWGLDRSDQRNLPIDGTYDYTATGENVTAYILDSGINYSHVDFGGRANFGFDIFGEDGDDCNGHGTHVAGTVGGNQWGIAKNVDLVSVRVLNCENTGTISGVIDAIDWITENSDGPSVVNMSLVTSSTSTALDNAIEGSIDSGITFVIAAGNLDSDACNYSPSRVTKAIIVGATDDSDTRAYFSNYGSCVDLFAPGVDITSAAIGSDTATAIKKGTSMATPHVTGTVALYLQNHPDATPSEIESFLKSNATQDIVIDSNSDNNNLLYTIFDDSGDDGGGNANSAPDANFTYSSNFLAVQFSDGSTDSDGSISSWSWNFDDGSTSTNENPSHTFSQSGTYGVSLTVTDDSGDSDTISKNVTVDEEVTNTPPSADFSYSADYLEVQFNDESGDSDGSISDWSWNFGDGSSSLSKNPSHTYSQAGTYTVSLTVTDDSGDSDVTSKSVTVEEQVQNTPPSADFSFNIDNLSVQFNDQSNDYDGSISNWSWNFGDGSSSSSVNPSHTYSQAGTYTVSLTVTDNDGDSDSVSKSVTVTEPANSNSISLDVYGYTSRRRWAANLTWDGASSSRVDIYRDGSVISSTRNDGRYSDRTHYRGHGSLTYQVCESGTNTCSEEVTVNY